jgi:type IV secretory pathway VirB9-like protein
MNPPINRENLREALIAVAIGSAVALCVNGCAAQPPPPPIIKVQTPKPQIVIPADPFNGLAPEVRTAIESNRTPTLHSGITTLYAYSPDVQWTIDCAPLRATELRLAPSEHTDKDSVVLGDSVRWAVRIGQHSVMVEPLGTPADPRMQTNLIISTNQHSYHLMLRLRSRYMSSVAWYYPDDVRAAEAQRQAALKLAAAQSAQTATADPPASSTQFKQLSLEKVAQ